MANEQDKIRNDKYHYETLISIFKYMVGAIVLLTGIIAWVIGSNLSDARNNLTKDLNELKTEIKTMRTESQASIKESNELAERQIENLRKNTEIYINMTKDITSMQIATIREDAKNLVLSSTRLKIEEAFKSNDIQSLIDDAAKKEIGNRLDEVVEREMNKNSIIFDQLPILTNAYEKIFWGDRDALNILDSLATYSENQTIKKIARGYLLQKGKDYIDAIPEEIGIDMSKFDPFNQLGIKLILPISKSDSIKIKSDLQRIILRDRDLFKVTYAFMALRNFTNQDINPFDIESIRNLKIIK